jgi:N,N'-diacetyllegionaminate synthase
MTKVYIIAEAGINHNGDLKTAYRLIDAAKKAGVDAVKFQTFTAKNTISKFAPKADYQIESTDTEESQYEMIKKFELSKENHAKLMKYCNNKGIEFLSTPFDLESIDLLDDLGVKKFKIPSGEITNLPYIRSLSKKNKPLIISTGMANLSEIEQALDIVTLNGLLRKDVTILHCNTEYPTPIDDVNLNAMRTIKHAFPGVKVGYSDHTLGLEVPIAATALGATVIEKHFTLDKTMDGPDHKTSLEPDELKAMVEAIRNIESAMGNGIKQASNSELKNKPIARKSIVANSVIKKGDIYTDKNLAVKRPGNGISPMRWDDILGRKAIHEFKEDELIEI